MPPPALPFFFLLLLLLLVGPALCRHRHVITLPSSSADLRPSSLAWDPSGQHFLVSSRHVISSVSDAGVVETLTLTLTSDPSSDISAIAIDDSGRRLIAAFSTPASIAAYDLRSPRPHKQIFSSPLPDPSTPIAGLAVDPATGKTFLTLPNAILASDPEGNISVLSKSPILDQLSGLAYVSRGYLLVAGRTGKVFKVDADDGAAKEVILAGKKSSSSEAVAVAVRSDGSAILAGSKWARWVKSGDGWGEAGVYDEVEAGEGERVCGAAVREGRREYLLVGPAEEGWVGKWVWRVEEVEWGREGEGEMVVGMVLVGLGMAYFMYWRFQMGKLVSSVNKKRA